MSRKIRLIAVVIVIAAAAIAVVTLIVINNGSSSAGYPQLRTARLGSVQTVPGQPRVLQITLFTSGFCKGSERPPIPGPVDVVEGPGNHAVVTGHVRYYGRKLHVVCLGVGKDLVKRVKFARPASDLIVYDGSVSPPRPLSTLIGK
jgi:hypothetical protein